MTCQPGSPRSARVRSPILGAAVAATLLLSACTGSIVPRPRITDSPAPSVNPTVSPGAAETPTPQTATPAPTPMTYRVRAGDTLGRIANRFKRTIGQLLTANTQITDPNHIEIGQVLVIPAADAPDIPPSIAVVVDARNDLVDRTGADVSGQGYADFQGFAVRLRGVDLSMELQLLGSPPSVDPAIETITYTIQIDADGDGQPDYTVTYGNAVTGPPLYAAKLHNIATGQDLPGRLLPRHVPGVGQQHPDRSRAERADHRQRDRQLLGGGLCRTHVPAGRSGRLAGGIQP